MLRLASALFCILSCIACTNPATVGEGRDACETGTDCPATSPYCDVELLVCFQCLEAAHCGGADPRCDEGRCTCESDADCGDSGICTDGSC
jgi:hypothetical protein